MAARFGPDGSFAGLQRGSDARSHQLQARHRLGLRLGQQVARTWVSHARVIKGVSHAKVFRAKWSSAWSNQKATRKAAVQSEANICPARGSLAYEGDVAFHYSYEFSRKMCKNF